MNNARGLSAFLMLFVACSPITVKTNFDPDVNFTGLHKFAWVQPIEGENPAADISIDFRRRLRTAIETALVGGDFDVSSDPDFLVAYYTHVKSGVWVTTWGYRQTPWRNRWYRYEPKLSWYHQVEKYEVGTLVIDIIDAKTSKLLWRGWGQGTSSSLDGLLIEAAKKVLERFPPPSDQLDPY